MKVRVRIDRFTVNGVQVKGFGSYTFPLEVQLNDEAPTDADTPKFVHADRDEEFSDE
jgi:hypothetical protein